MAPHTLFLITLLKYDRSRNLTFTVKIFETSKKASCTFVSHRSLAELNFCQFFEKNNSKVTQNAPRFLNLIC